MLAQGMARMHHDDEAVSPVIATVLLLAITVMLSGMVFVLMQGALNTAEKAPPQMTVSVRALDNGYHVIRITTLTKHSTLHVSPSNSTNKVPVSIHL